MLVSKIHNHDIREIIGTNALVNIYVGCSVCELQTYNLFIPQDSSKVMKVGLAVLCVHLGEEGQLGC